ncbi:hypothetical protein C0992_011484 [Termitomyces sp. T32_za158]|nr:hypothetical protein C0992_011484 [Termitomyces sp. T32_za158]
MDSIDRRLPKASLLESLTDSNMRGLLLSALDLAREAVSLDTANDGPKALVKYTESVWLLRELLERIRAGGGGQRNRVYATREEQRHEENKIQDIVLMLVKSTPPPMTPDVEFDIGGICGAASHRTPIPLDFWAHYLSELMRERQDQQLLLKGRVPRPNGRSSICHSVPGVCILGAVKIYTCRVVSNVVSTWFRQLSKGSDACLTRIASVASGVT